MQQRLIGQTRSLMMRHRRLANRCVKGVHHLRRLFSCLVNSTPSADFQEVPNIWVLLLVPTLVLVQNTSGSLQCCRAASFLSVFHAGSSVRLLSLVLLRLPVPLPVSTLQFDLLTIREKTPQTGWPISIGGSDNQTRPRCPQSDDVISARARAPARARVLSSPPGQGFLTRPGCQSGIYSG